MVRWTHNKPRQKFPSLPSTTAHSVIESRVGSSHSELLLQLSSLRLTSDLCNFVHIVSERLGTLRHVSWRRARGPRRAPRRHGQCAMGREPRSQHQIRRQTRRAVSCMASAACRRVPSRATSEANSLLNPQDYKVPVATALSKKESHIVECYLLVREQVHASPLYTHTQTSRAEATRAYGQDQINQRYGVQNKATIDPFVAVPLYSNRFEKPERTLPDLLARPFST